MQRPACLYVLIVNTLINVNVLKWVSVNNLFSYGFTVMLWLALIKVMTDSLYTNSVLILKRSNNNNVR